MNAHLYLVDFENVPGVDLSTISFESRVIVFTGVYQKLVSLELVSATKGFTIVGSSALTLGRQLQSGSPKQPFVGGGNWHDSDLSNLELARLATRDANQPFADLGADYLRARDACYSRRSHTRHRKPRSGR